MPSSRDAETYTSYGQAHHDGGLDMSEVSVVQVAQWQLESLKCENRRLRIALVLLLSLGAGLALFAQTRATAPVPGPTARYQLVTESAIPIIFDTQTGIRFVWMPRDEKAGEDPYLTVQDPVNATGTLRAIRWTDTRAK